jgi:hypothetical protein
MASRDRAIFNGANAGGVFSRDAEPSALLT